MQRKNLILGVLGILIIAAIFTIESSKPERTSSGTDDNVAVLSKTEKAARYEPAKEISTPDGFINTDSITLGEFIGKKVVLVDFWTYSCINCQRTLPYLNAWYEKYADKGLVIIGLHTPEFEFEKKYENVTAAVKKFDIRYPVVLDNDYSTWTAYKNRYWPRKYLVDIDGFIVYDHIGEGGYEDTERAMQAALNERLQVLHSEGTIESPIADPSGVATSGAQSPEVYFGASRNEYLGNGTPGTTGITIFTNPPEIVPNTLYLTGTWNLEDEHAENVASGAKIIFRYRAKDVYFVAGSDAANEIEIRIDGKPPTGILGDDLVMKSGRAIGTIREERLYRLIEGAASEEHTIEIIVKNPGLRTFTFTFG
ncbi:MAG: redoxin family protein [Patescibacteria group bacterium]